MSPSKSTCDNPCEYPFLVKALQAIPLLSSILLFHFNCSLFSKLFANFKIQHFDLYTWSLLPCAMSSDSDSSIELVFDSSAPVIRKKSLDNADNKPKSSAQNGFSENKILQPVLTHYRCIKFDHLSEIELNIHHWSNNVVKDTEQVNVEQGCFIYLFRYIIIYNFFVDFAKTIAQTQHQSDLIVYFALISGKAESFGIPLVPNRLYSIKFGSRFIAQTFHGCEFCFMIKNPDTSFDIHAKFTDPPAYRPKNLPPDVPTPMHTEVKNMEFIQFSQTGFTSFNPKNETLSTTALTSLIHSSKEQKTGLQAKINHSSRMSEHLRLNCIVKQFGKRGPQKPPSWTYQSYARFAQELNHQRMDASKCNRPGPNIIIVGPTDAAKSTFCKVIINYAINNHWSPMFVDLDVGQGSIGVPGVVGAGIVDKYCQLDEEYTFRSGYPISSHYGAVSPESDQFVHFLSVNCLARQIVHSLRAEEEQANKKSTSASSSTSQLPPNLNQITLAERLSSSKRSQELRPISPMQSNGAKQQKRQLTKWSGLVINTHGWIFDYGYESTMDAIRKFVVSIVLVLGDYRFYERIHKDLLGYDVSKGPTRHSFNNSGIKVHFFQRNFSVIKRSSKLRYVLCYYF